MSQDIYEIALKQFGVEKYWHKRIVRSGPNTLTIAADNPPVRTIDRNDIVYIDLGPVFEDWEGLLLFACSERSRKLSVGGQGHEITQWLL
jgi:hypothetical protein